MCSILGIFEIAAGVDLQALRQRIRDFQSAHAVELAGETELDLLASDPRHTVSKFAS